jgi:hypothetical protein
VSELRDAGHQLRLERAVELALNISEIGITIHSGLDFGELSATSAK